MNFSVWFGKFTKIYGFIELKTKMLLYFLFEESQQSYLLIIIMLCSTEQHSNAEKWNLIFLFAY